MYYGLVMHLTYVFVLIIFSCCTRVRFNGPVSRFTRVGRSPFNLLCHSTRSWASSRLRPISFMSLFTTSIHIFFGLPLDLGPSTSKTLQPFTQSQSSFLSTCPNHLSLFHFTTTPIASTPILSLDIALVIFSLRETPHIILIILISALVIILTIVWQKK